MLVGGHYRISGDESVEVEYSGERVRMRRYGTRSKQRSTLVDLGRRSLGAESVKMEYG